MEDRAIEVLEPERIAELKSELTAERERDAFINRHIERISRPCIRRRSRLTCYRIRIILASSIKCSASIKI